ncbi:MAG: glycosyltransferase family A protein [Planctomycetota bacterium]
MASRPVRPNNGCSAGTRTDLSTASLAGVGIVVIGRNEAAHLRSALRTALATGVPVVYADSGSTDASLEIARGMGVTVVELDQAQPHTAARGRNAGLNALRRAIPDLEFVQFVDGDCELAEGWLTRGVEFLRGTPTAWAVWGELAEADPRRSVFHRLCDLEWRYDIEPGEVESCGGVVLLRAAPLVRLGGFDATLAAGEEPELCARLRAAGGRVFYLAAAMARHDAGDLGWRDWWRRQVRTGTAYADGAQRARATGGRRWARQEQRILLWGAVLPLAIAATAVPTGGLSLLGLTAYLVPTLRSASALRRRGAPAWPSLCYGAFASLAKFPQLVGWLRHHVH